MPVYQKAKNRGCRPYEVIHPNAKHPILRDAIDDIIHSIGFREQREWEASLVGAKLK